MTFGWQGFRLDHPDDWAPVSLTGDRDSGYARLASAGRLALQMRWQRGKPSDDLGSRLRAYLDRLQADAKKARETFAFETAEVGDQLHYRWRGTGRGAGAIFHSPCCKRTFMVETVGGKKDTVRPTQQRILESFASGEPHWCVLGLSLRLDATLQKHVFHAGRTELHFNRKGATICASRWGFAEQLMAKHTLEDWARASTDMPKASVIEEDFGLRLSARSLLRRTEALIRLDPAHNQIITVKTTFRKDEDAPEWAWLL